MPYLRRLDTWVTSDLYVGFARRHVRRGAESRTGAAKSVHVPDQVEMLPVFNEELVILAPLSYPPIRLKIGWLAVP